MLFLFFCTNGEKSGTAHQTHGCYDRRLEAALKLRKNSRLPGSYSQPQLSFCMAGPDIGVPPLPHNEHGCLLWSQAMGSVALIETIFISRGE